MRDRQHKKVYTNNSVRLRQNDTYTNAMACSNYGMDFLNWKGARLSSSYYTQQFQVRLKFSSYTLEVMHNQDVEKLLYKKSEL